MPESLDLVRAVRALNDALAVAGCPDAIRSAEEWSDRVGRHRPMLNFMSFMDESLAPHDPVRGD
jgi:hypothetical protein